MITEPLAAPPPDVRKAFGLPERNTFIRSHREAKPRDASILHCLELSRKGEAFPHIERHSRTHAPQLLP